MTTEKFKYKHGNKTVTLPYTHQIPFGVTRRLRKEDEAEQTFAVLEAITDAKSLAVIDDMTQGEVGEMVKAWQKASEATMGESGASATS